MLLLFVRAQVNFTDARLAMMTSGPAVSFVRHAGDWWDLNGLHKRLDCARTVLDVAARLTAPPASSRLAARTVPTWAAHAEQAPPPASLCLSSWPAVPQVLACVGAGGIARPMDVVMISTRAPAPARPATCLQAS